MITDILSEITDKDREYLEEMRNNCLNGMDYDDPNRLGKCNAINKFLILEDELRKIRTQKQNAITYIVKELITINKHQYASGSRRLKKILHILEENE